MAPFHAPDDNPSLALHRDLELVQRLDALGYDEVWIGEHHSGGWEPIAAPELFLAVAAERTQNIRLGTGAISLPYHHPLVVADRIMLLDHLTRGRVNFGVGPGGHLSDALMFGLEPGRLREMMAESLGVIMRLFTEPEPFDHVSDWFELHDAVLQLRPHQYPHPPISVTSLESPAGMELAGRHGAGVLQLAVAKGPRGPIDLAAHWAIAEESAVRHGQNVRRADWRLVVPIYLAETRTAAFKEARHGAGRFLLEYVEGVTGRPRPVPGPADLVIDQMTEAGGWIVGTPDDAVAAIKHLQERSGGFGGLLIWGHEWASREGIMRSYELFARHVMPHFNGQVAGTQASNRVVTAKSPALNAERTAAVEAAQARYDSGQKNPS